MEAEVGVGPEVAENEGFQRREWAVERTAWVFFTIVLLAAALGLFGGGPLSHATANAGGVQLDYERFARRAHAFDMTLRLDSAQDASVTVELGNEFLTAFDIEEITPRPAREIATPDATRFEFATAPGSPVLFKLRVIPSGFGRRAGTVFAAGADVPYSILVYP